MPKAYSSEEKEYIRQQLKKEALDCLIRYGVRKTTVDELVRRVHIPKGTFYLFYPSKEVLLFDAVNEVHDGIQKRLIGELTALGRAATADDVINCIYGYFVELDQTQLTGILMHGDFELMVRRLPQEKVEQHFLKDQEAMKELFFLFPEIANKPLGLYESALRAVFMTVFHKREIGEEHYYETVKLMLKGIIGQMLNGLE